jgi:hypothetical protein
MTTNPDPPTVIANLEILTNKLRYFFEAEAKHANAMQDRYVGALTAIANFLKRSGIDEDIAQKLLNWRPRSMTSAWAPSQISCDRPWWAVEVLTGWRSGLVESTWSSGWSAF